MLIHISLFVLGIAGGLLLSYMLHKKILAKGNTLHLSLSAFDEQLLKSGKVCNGRISQTKELANAAYGDTGLSVIITETF